MFVVRSEDPLLLTHPLGLAAANLQEKVKRELRVRDLYRDSTPEYRRQNIDAKISTPKYP